jgi:hypothetical protein
MARCPRGLGCNTTPYVRRSHAVHDGNGLVEQQQQLVYRGSSSRLQSYHQLGTFSTPLSGLSLGFVRPGRPPRPDSDLTEVRPWCPRSRGPLDGSQHVSRRVNGLGLAPGAPAPPVTLDGPLGAGTVASRTALPTLVLPVRAVEAVLDAGAHCGCGLRDEVCGTG